MAPSVALPVNETESQNLKSLPYLAQKPNYAVIAKNAAEEDLIAAKYGVVDNYVNAESDTLWYHWQGNIYVKPLRFEGKTGTYVIALSSSDDANLGKHQHRGAVTGYTVKGSWGYREYDWLAHQGDYIVENPGTIHTLFMSKDSEVVFTVTGSIEFFEADGALREIMDLFSFWRMYVRHCEERNIKPNEALWY